MDSTARNPTNLTHLNTPMTTDLDAIPPARRLNYAEKVKAGMVERKPRQRINPVSAKRAREGVEYMRLRRKYLEAFPVCEFPGCACREGLEIHHKARRGRFYLRTDTWMSVCAMHHRHIEQNPEWSKENGYILTAEQRRAIA